MDLTLSEPASEPRTILKAAVEAWPLVAGLGAIVFWVAVLSTRVDTHADQIKEDRDQQKEILKVVNDMRADVAAVRAILEERQKQ